MFYNSNKLLRLVGKNGEIPSLNTKEIQASIAEAETITKRMLGGTLVVRGSKFILSSLELYYGGIGDYAHDWYRSNFLKKTANDRTEIQNEEGLKIYQNQRGNGRYKRMDIVIGPQGVPISLLVRNVMRPTGELIGSNMGGPNMVLNAIGILEVDHGKSLSAENDISFIDTHSEYITRPEEQIKTMKRVIGGRACGFNDGPFGQHPWNFSIYNLNR